MTTARNRFLSFLMKECSGLNYVLLNYIYNDTTELPSKEPLEILIDKDDYATLLYVISTGNGILRVKTKRTLYAQIVDIKFTDQTKLNLKIKIDIELNGIILMNAGKVLRTSIKNNDNIKIPAPCHQFEYVLLNSILRKKDVEEKYRIYFSNFNFEVRSKIFAHIRPKYNFVINLLDDLYNYNRNYYRKVRTEIWAEKQNTGWRYAFHKISFAIVYVSMALSNRWDQITSRRTEESQDRTVARQLRDLLHKKAVIKIL